jgi:uncharacterized protein YbaP (TraB family)
MRASQFVEKCASDSVGVRRIGANCFVSELYCKLRCLLLRVFELPKLEKASALTQHLIQAVAAVFLILVVQSVALAEGVAVTLERGKHRISLVGILHTADASQTFVEVVKQQLKNSQNVYFEANVWTADAIAEYQHLAQRFTQFDYPDTVLDDLSRILGIDRKLKLFVDVTRTMHPADFDYFLSSKLFGVKKGQGLRIEDELFSAAKITGVQIQFLETPFEAASYYTSLKRQESLALVKRSILAFDDVNVKEQRREWATNKVDIYRAGKCERLNNAYSSFVGSSNLEKSASEKINAYRNRKWVKILDPATRAPGRSLVVVGMLHLCYEETLIDLLVKRGFAVVN